MARYELKLPQMGESVEEATITSWLKNVGDTIEVDDIIVEVATDKVDSEIPCDVSGVITEILFAKDSVVKVGQVMAIIETEPQSVGEVEPSPQVQNIAFEEVVQQEVQPEATAIPVNEVPYQPVEIKQENVNHSQSERFYSPLVKTIAKEENISLEELEQIQGSGLEGRVTKNDILNYVSLKKGGSSTTRTWETNVQTPTQAPILEQVQEIIHNNIETVSEREESKEDLQGSVNEDFRTLASNEENLQTPITEELKVEEMQPIVSEPIIEPIQVSSEISSPVDKKEEPVQVAHKEEVKPEPIQEEKVIFPDLDAFVNSLSSQNTQKEEAKPVEPQKQVTFAEKPAEINIKMPENKPEEKPATISHTPSQVDDNVEVIEMTRMGKLISKYMIESRRTSAHVQSFTEVDVTRIWNWRNKVKKSFEAREGQKFTFTPIFMEAVAKALRDYPMMNVSTDGERIFKKKQINIGMATALPNGDLIVPVIKNADQLSLIGLTKSVNDLAKRARESKLKPDEIKGGTYTVTNIGAFGNIFGTPIINQPEVGILAIGSIQKVPAVIETPEGDVIGIRYKLILSHSYDHRVVNGALGGMFVQRVAEYLENWDINREI